MNRHHEAFKQEISRATNQAEPDYFALNMLVNDVINACSRRHLTEEEQRSLLNQAFHVLVESKWLPLFANKFKKYHQKG